MHSVSSTSSSEEGRAPSAWRPSTQRRHHAIKTVDNTNTTRLSYSDPALASPSTAATQDLSTPDDSDVWTVHYHEVNSNNPNAKAPHLDASDEPSELITAIIGAGTAASLDAASYDSSLVSKDVILQSAVMAPTSDDDEDDSHYHRRCDQHMRGMAVDDMIIPTNLDDIDLESTAASEMQGDGSSGANLGDWSSLSGHAASYFERNADFAALLHKSSSSSPQLRNVTPDSGSAKSLPQQQCSTPPPVMTPDQQDDVAAVPTNTSWTSPILFRPTNLLQSLKKMATSSNSKSIDSAPVPNDGGEHLCSSSNSRTPSPQSQQSRSTDLDFFVNDNVLHSRSDNSSSNTMLSSALSKVQHSLPLMRPQSNIVVPVDDDVEAGATNGAALKHEQQSDDDREEASNSAKSENSQGSLHKTPAYCGCYSKRRRCLWMIGLLLVAAIIAIAVFFLLSSHDASSADSNSRPTDTQTPPNQGQHPPVIVDKNTLSPTEAASATTPPTLAPVQTLKTTAPSIRASTSPPPSPPPTSMFVSSPTGSPTASPQAATSSFPTLPMPANGVCDAAQMLEADGTIVQGNLLGTRYESAPPVPENCSAANIGTWSLDTTRGLWYAVIGTGDRFLVNLCSDQYDLPTARLRLLRNTCAALEAVCPIDGGDNGCTFVWKTESGVTYYLYLMGGNAGTNDVTVQVMAQSLLQ